MTGQERIQNPHSLSPNELLLNSESRPEGLTSAEVKERQAAFGFNELPEQAGEHWITRLLRQFKSLLVTILIAAAVFSWFTGHELDAWVIMGIVVLNALIGFTQEQKATKAMAALQKMMIASAKVIREGELLLIQAREVVPGDVLVVEEGDSIAADARLLTSQDLRTTEAALTGESLPVNKQVPALPENTPMADRRNMLWKGTFVAGGYANALVTATGAQTAFGEIAGSLSKIEPGKSNFQKKADVLARQMGLVSIGCAVLLFAVGYFFRDFNTYELLLISIAALVSAIPEGLPAVLSIVLAIGANRMTSRKAIIREFTATETLGSVTAIITDKTGTLTQNTLTTKRIWLAGQPEIFISGDGWSSVGSFEAAGKPISDLQSSPALIAFLRIAGWCNNAAIRNNPEKNTSELVGDPTEGALLVVALKAGLNPGKKNPETKKISDLPFNSKLKMRASLVRVNGRQQLLVVGAPEKVIQAARFWLTEQGEQELTPQVRQQIQEQINKWAGDALRVIALAYRNSPGAESINAGMLGEDLVFVGLAGMADPPRPDVREAVESCHQAGIRVIMATGDHVNTAVAIANQTGILSDTDNGKERALTETDLVALTEEQFSEAVASVNVFARLTPNMKLRIAEKLQQQGHLIAMTGDGVNDAPALKRADVGIAMGIMGTDVARESAKVVLADDNFSTIVHAIEEGRIVFTNARQTSFFLITTNFAEIITLITVILLGLPMPLTATQILWLNLVTDGIGTLALAAEKGNDNVLHRKPVARTEAILNKSVLPFLAINVVLMTALSLMVYHYYLPAGLPKARTAVFIVMAFTQLFNLFNMRSLEKSAFKIGLFSNFYLNIALLFSVVLQVVIIEIPLSQRLFGFVNFGAVEFIVLAGISSLVFWVGELYKFFRSRRIIH